jgi:glucose-1-phosphate thymidylyltransferase
VREIQVKQKDAGTNWIWGAFKMPGHVFHELYELWRKPQRGDEYFGTLINAWLATGGRATAIRAGQGYVDVGTLHGYRSAIRLLEDAEFPSAQPQAAAGQEEEQSNAIDTASR